KNELWSYRKFVARSLAVSGGQIIFDRCYSGAATPAQLSQYYIDPGGRVVGVRWDTFTTFGNSNTKFITVNEPVEMVTYHKVSSGSDGVMRYWLRRLEDGDDWGDPVAEVTNHTLTAAPSYHRPMCLIGPG